MHKDSLNEIDSCLESIELLLDPTKFRTWLREADDEYQTDIIALIIEQNKLEESSPQNNIDGDFSLRNYSTPAPLEPKVKLEIVLGGKMTTLKTSVQNVITPTLNRIQDHRPLIEYVCLNLTRINDLCNQNSIFNEYTEIIGLYLNSFKKWAKTKYDLTTTFSLTNSDSETTEIIQSYKKCIDDSLGHLKISETNRLGEFLPSEYERFKDLLANTIIQNQIPENVQRFRTIHISGESLKYSFYLLIVNIGDSPAMRRLIATFAIKALEVFRNREIDPFISSIRRKPKKFPY